MSKKSCLKLPNLRDQRHGAGASLRVKSRNWSNSTLFGQSVAGVLIPHQARVCCPRQGHRRQPFCRIMRFGCAPKFGGGGGCRGSPGRMLHAPIL